MNKREQYFHFHFYPEYFHFHIEYFHFLVRVRERHTSLPGIVQPVLEAMHQVRIDKSALIFEIYLEAQTNKQTNK